MIKNLERVKYLPVYSQSSGMEHNGEVYEIFCSVLVLYLKASAECYGYEKRQFFRALKLFWIILSSFPNTKQIYVPDVAFLV